MKKSFKSYQFVFSVGLAVLLVGCAAGSVDVANGVNSSGGTTSGGSATPTPSPASQSNALIGTWQTKNCNSWGPTLFSNGSMYAGSTYNYVVSSGGVKSGYLMYPYVPGVAIGCTGSTVKTMGVVNVSGQTVIVNDWNANPYLSAQGNVSGAPAGFIAHYYKAPGAETTSTYMITIALVAGDKMILFQDGNFPIGLIDSIGSPTLYSTWVAAVSFKGNPVLQDQSWFPTDTLSWPYYRVGGNKNQSGDWRTF